MSFKNLSQRYLYRLGRELSFFLPLALIFFLSINLLQPTTAFEKAKKDILANPTDPSPHLTLAESLLAQNQINLAEKELLAASPLSKSPTDQERFAHASQELITLKNAPVQVQEKIIWWSSTIDTLANYRDAYLELAILNWKIYRPFDAQKYLDKATEIDPNSVTVSQIQENLK